MLCFRRSGKMQMCDSGKACSLVLYGMCWTSVLQAQDLQTLESTNFSRRAAESECLRHRQGASDPLHSHIDVQES